MVDHGVQKVGVFGRLLEEMMHRAQKVKNTDTVEPALSKSNFDDLIEKLETEFYLDAKSSDLRKPGFAIIESAVRDRFNNLLVSTGQSGKEGIQEHI